MEVALRPTFEPPEASRLRRLTFISLETELELSVAPTLLLRHFSALRAHAEHERRSARSASRADEPPVDDEPAPDPKRPRTAPEGDGADVARSRASQAPAPPSLSALSRSTAPP